MKLDRNINPDGRGKYALIKMRKISELIATGHNNYERVMGAVDILSAAGLIHWGDEGPGEQFFVMKYKDKFTPPALRAYAAGIYAANPEDDSLKEYASEVFAEADLAAKTATRIPD